MSDLASSIVEFCARLRSDHGFALGPRETRDAMRTIETLGIRERARVAGGLRAVCCGRRDEIPVFDRAFNAFFSSGPLGELQPAHAPRRGHADRRRPPIRGDAGERATETELQPERESLAQAWHVMRARYSPAPGAAQAPAIPLDGLDRAIADANRLVARLHRGRSLRWKPHRCGVRFDLRRTLRASLRTGGEILAPRMLDRPLRNPRFALLLDGSRSMSEYAERMLQFAYALCRRTRRAHAYVFSTQLLDVTRRLRIAGRNGSYRLEDLGEAWGGGTRIGESLHDFVRRHAARLNDETYVVVISDGLDVGNTARLKRAMQNIARRCAGIAWLNPHAALHGYEPAAAGMQTALPYVSVFAPLDDVMAIARA